MTEQHDDDGSDYPLVFRPCRLKDAPAMLSLSEALFPSMYTTFYYEILVLPDDAFFTLGCFIQDRLVGFIVMIKDCVKFKYFQFCSPEPEKKLVESFEDKVGLITTLGVAKEHQRRQIGSFLLTQAIYYLAEHSMNAVYLNVNVDNTKAISFYTKHGFVVYSLLKNYYTTTGGFESHDALLLYRVVTSKDNPNGGIIGRNKEVTDQSKN